MIPPEAREGLMRAWIAILEERHPGVTWIARNPDVDDEPSEVLTEAEKAA